MKAKKTSSTGKYPPGPLDQHKKMATGDMKVGFKKGGKTVMKKNYGGRC